MVIKSKCSKCDYILSVPEEFRGKKLRCPECSEVNLMDDKEGETQYNEPIPSGGPPTTSLQAPTPSSSSLPKDPPSSFLEERPMASSSSSSFANTQTFMEERRLPRTSSSQMNLHLREVGEATLLFAYILTLLIFIVGLLPFFFPSLSFLAKIIILLVSIIFAGLVFICLKGFSALLMWFADSQ